MNQRQSTFVSSYLKNGNATEAAIDAGYSERSAYNQGQRMMKNDEIIKAIKQSQDKVSKNTGITVAQIVKKISGLATRSKSDNVKARCYDMLMRHVGGYVNELAIINKMSDEDLEKIVSKMMDKI